MSAYVVVQISIHDPEMYEAYKALAAASVEAHGGRYLARGGATQTLEGSWSPSRLVILQFPSVQAARAWWSSADYAEARRIRQASADTEMLLVDGLEP